MPKPIGSISLWQDAQDGSTMCASSTWRKVVAPLVSATILVLTVGGGGGISVHKSSDKTYLPRRTGEVRSECELTSKSPPCDNRPRRWVLFVRSTRVI